jgi:protein-S-isoprenylcysteine O-methyltransferase Ste14
MATSAQARIARTTLGKTMRFLELRIPPPVIVVACAGLMWGLAHVWPAFALWPRGAWPFGLGAALGLALIGIVVSLAGKRAFRRAHTTSNPLAPMRSSTLVTTGVYRFTRNPMYLGTLLILIGWAVYLGNPATLLGPLLAALLLTQLQIKPEERILRELFAEHYTDYAAQVRRWI